MPLLRSTSAANAGHVDSSNGLTVSSATTVERNPSAWPRVRVVGRRSWALVAMRDVHRERKRQEYAKARLVAEAQAADEEQPKRGLRMPRLRRR